MKQYNGHITIREATADDADQLCTWWNDGQIMAHAGFPLGLGTTPEVIRQKIESDNNCRHMILYDGTPIGEMNYRETEPGVCEIGIKICDATMQNKGLGKQILSMFIEGLFDECGYEKIILDTNLNNLRAQHVYEQLGFRKIRIRENSWTDQLGKLQSAVDYELTKDCFVSYAGLTITRYDVPTI
ncbi:MAG: GNAT family N-acetyltransferase [Clostridia bacterium]|nr:GNAT family N-acetyltransferase [Clostridia bacterium]